MPNHDWISCANKTLTQKENKIKFFRLCFAQWQKHFEKNIRPSSDSTGQWPILKRSNCHCGIWINRVRHERLFDDNWLIKLEESHNTMHNVADDLFKKYQADEIDSAREGLKGLEKAAASMNGILGECE